MALLRIVIAGLCSIAGVSIAWPDCSSKVTSLGPFGEGSQFNATDEEGVPVFIVHPPLPGKAPYPIMIFSHGTTAEYAMYEFAINHYVSHGFVVIFPHIKGPVEDVSPLTLDPHGGFAIKGVHYAIKVNSNSSSILYNMLDLKNLVLVGHSMGASTTIMAAKLVPLGVAKLAIAQHPGICGPFGPPPWPSTWMKEDFQEASNKMPIILTTATNDGAFWPAPLTAEHERGCFQNSVDAAFPPKRAAFAQFFAGVCEDDGSGERNGRKWSTAGHNCPLKIHSVETPWVLVAAKLYAQLGGDVTSQCYKMLWGNETDSLQKDPDVQISVITELSNDSSNTAMLV